METIGRFQEVFGGRVFGDSGGREAAAWKGSGPLVASAFGDHESHRGSSERLGTLNMTLLGC